MTSEFLRGEPLPEGFAVGIERQLALMESALRQCKLGRLVDEESSPKRSPWAIDGDRRPLISALLKHAHFAVRVANQLETSVNGRFGIDEAYDPDGYVIPDREKLWGPNGDDEVSRLGVKLRSALDRMRIEADEAANSVALALIKQIADRCDEAEIEFVNQPDGRYPSHDRDEAAGV